MVSKTVFASQNKRILFSKNISTDIKNTSNLFSHIILQLKDKYPNIQLQENKVLTFITKIQLRKIVVEIQDSVEGNFIKLDIVPKEEGVKQFFKSFTSRRILGVRMGSIIILIALLCVLSVLIAIYWQNALALLLVGISSVVLAVIAVILYGPLSKVFSYAQSNRHKAILEIADEIERIIYDYSNQETALKKCWNCFKEVSSEQDYCKNCNEKLIDRH